MTLYQSERVPIGGRQRFDADCLLSDANASEDFEDFCSEFGYDPDSRKAEKTHKACLKVRENMQRLLGDDFETFLYADRN